MKNPTGTAKPRRTAAPKADPKKRIRLDLKRSSYSEPEKEAVTAETGHFWRWVWLVALFHVIVIAGVALFYALTASSSPPQEFISLLPDGDVVKGTPGTQAAHKTGPTTPANATHHTAKPPPPMAEEKVPKLHPPPKLLPTPKPIPLDTENPLAKQTPPKPKPPKVKVDLNLVDGPTPAVDRPKLKPHLKKPKPTLRPDDDANDDSDSSAKPDTTGLSKEQIASKLGDKLDAAGVKNATQIGKSGSANAHPDNFADFYAAIRDQVMSQWQSPNLADETAVNPIVQIHVEKDGRVPTESVHLIQSSGNPSYDDSAVAAAKSLGYLHEPLPEGCNPDIPITFKLTR